MSGEAPAIGVRLCHSYDPWTGMCQCGAGPFLRGEHAAHVRTTPPAEEAGR